MKTLSFLAGLPRSGSTVLGSILNKHSLFFVPPTSPLLDLICIADRAVYNLDQQYTFNLPQISYNVSKGLLYSFYQNVEKPIVLDKHRGWPRNLNVAQAVLDQEFKGLVTVRPVPEVIVSFLKLIQKDPANFVDKHLMEDLKPLTTRNRADYLWRFYISDPYESTKFGLENFRDRLLVINYDDIVSSPHAVVRSVEDFFGTSHENLDLGEIDNTCSEAKDAAWGLADLHTIRPTLSRTSDDPRSVLGNELFDFYSQFNLKV